jgi:hypothetical protein
VKLNFASATLKIRLLCSPNRMTSWATICNVLFFFQMRLREIGKAEEVLRASFRELNTNMNSWNREFFEGLRCVPCVDCVELKVVPDNSAATCSLDSSIRTTTLSSWDKKLSDTFNALQFASCLMRINITAEHWTLPWNPIDRPNLI